MTVACQLGVLVLLACATPILARPAIACSAYVDPCHCGLCPRIVNCNTTQSAECFCGGAMPGVYPHPSDPAKAWHCSRDPANQTPYGVEVACPARLVFDPVVQVCTLPSAVTPAPAASSSNASKPAVNCTTPVAKQVKAQVDAKLSVKLQHGSLN